MRWWLLVTLLGCNQVFGLDPTVKKPPPVDSDGDGIEDVDDNCPHVVNVMQEDTDGDGDGDLCDLCVNVASDQHDDDDDGFGDDCDNCPGQFNRDQLDGDMDGVGNVCEYDRAMVRTTLVVFEPFVTLPAEWTTTGAAWQVSNDAAVMTSPPSASDPGLRNPTIKIATENYIVEIGFMPTRELQLGDVLGVGVIDAVGNETSCLLLCDGRNNPDNTLCGIEIMPSSSDSVDTPPVNTRWRLRLAVYRPGSDRFYCELLYDSGTFPDKNEMYRMQTLDLSPVIHSTPGLAVTYFTAWTH